MERSYCYNLETKYVVIIAYGVHEEFRIKLIHERLKRDPYSIFCEVKNNVIINKPDGKEQQKMDIPIYEITDSLEFIKKNNIKIHKAVYDEVYCTELINI